MYLLAKTAQMWLFCTRCLTITTGFSDYRTSSSSPVPAVPSCPIRPLYYILAKNSAPRHPLQHRQLLSPSFYTHTHSKFGAQVRHRQPFELLTFDSGTEISVNRILTSEAINRIPRPMVLGWRISRKPTIPGIHSSDQPDSQAFGTQMEACQPDCQIFGFEERSVCQIFGVEERLEMVTAGEQAIIPLASAPLQVPEVSLLSLSHLTIAVVS
ncbi:hypothetical protein BZA05DRAFT_409177 [Tricharina praecox]|uniref:uncharacterized protein n=1 Tax=Tricharina praecox TaxID=43433 RepID=UPI00221F9C57|nr:uncharacterized protein BZA05DRAFT_409177 [Tricharina praecox]KAI5844714.1 hypothetical protein BZA05DRAFT_409177 [Tricharina praecox]